MITNLPGSVLFIRIVSFCTLIKARIVHPEIRWSIVSLLVLNNLHLGSAPLWRVLAWKFLVKRFRSCVATKSLSVSNLSPAIVSHWLLSCKSASAVRHWSWYWPCNAFAFQAKLIALFLFSLAVLFNFWAFPCFLSLPLNSVSRYKSIPCANSPASFATECVLFFHTLMLAVASGNLINSSIEKDRLSVSCKTFRVGSKLTLGYFWGRKYDGHWALCHACCLFLSFF